MTHLFTRCALKRSCETMALATGGFHRSLPRPGCRADHRIAETWEFCDRPQESSEVINGPLAGLTLHDLIARYGERLLGSEIVASFGMRFPLLIKFLDASNPLGEQVHPNDEQARQMGRPDPGKTEAWYMLHVRGGQGTSGGGSVHCGNLPGVTREQARQAMFDGTIRDQYAGALCAAGRRVLALCRDHALFARRRPLLRDHAKLGRDTPAATMAWAPWDAPRKSRRVCLSRPRTRSTWRRALTARPSPSS